MNKTEAGHIQAGIEVIHQESKQVMDTHMATAKENYELSQMLENYKNVYQKLEVRIQDLYKEGSLKDTEADVLFE